MLLRQSFSFEWNGEEYSHVVTMADLAEIENSISLVKFSADCLSGDMKYTQAAVIAAFFMSKAKCVVTPDEFYLSLIGQGGEGAQVNASEIISKILVCAFPQSEKKSEPQAAKVKPKAKRKAKSKAT